MPRTRSLSGPQAVVLLAVLPGLLLLASCRRPPRGPSVLLVTIDTLRADRLGCYGHPGGPTPHLDALARRGALFEHATSPVPLTLPSHTSLLTGLYPFEHGVRENIGFAVPEEVTTLAEILSSAGWRTAAFTAAFPVSSETGIQQGFREFHDPLGKVDPRTGESLPPREAQFTAAEISSRAVQWLTDAPPSEPFFLWAHCYDPHEPYLPPPSFAARFPGSPYDAEVAWTDASLGVLFDRLESLDRRESILLIVTADHGESLGEHGERYHSIFLYESTQRVPLLIVWPEGGIRRARLDVPVSLVDVMPTVLRACGLPLPSELPGRDLLPLLRGDGPAGLEDRPIYLESLAGLYNHGWAPLRAIRKGSWKYVEAPREELYDLARDPEEEHDVSRGNPGRVRELRGDLRDLAPDLGQLANVPVPERALALLEALGYVGGVAPSESHDRRDPKDWIDVDNALRTSEDDLRDGRTEQALRKIEAVLRRDPDSGVALRNLARVYTKMNRPKEAEETLARAVALHPQSAHLHQAWARALLRVGRVDEAIRALRETVAREGHRWGAWLELGQAYLAKGRIDEAIAALERADELRPDGEAASILRRLRAGAANRGRPGPPASSEPVPTAGAERP